MQCRYLHFAIFLFLISSFLTACEKLVEVETPNDKLPTAKLFTDEKQALGALMAAYGELAGAPLYISNAGMSLYTGLSSDELVLDNSATDNFRNFARNEIDPNDEAGLGRNLWAAAYSTIGITNNVLEGLSGSDLQNAVKLPMRGEALVLRAWSYFCLINLFGDVPLITTTDVIQNNMAPRTQKVQIYSLIVGDLEEAARLLPEAYPAKDRMRVTQAVAYSMLAKFALFNQRWQQADYFASKVLEDEKFRLELPEDIFNIDSQEMIWQLVAAPDAAAATADVGLFMPSRPSMPPKFQISYALVDAFEQGDLRKEIWIKNSKSGDLSMFYSSKYRQKGGAAPWKEAHAVIRLAELMLIRAESRLHLGRIDEACDDLNRIRERAGLKKIHGVQPDRLFHAVMQERRIELMCEGHRWIDLNRTGLADSVLKPVKGNSYQSEDRLYPLPASQVRLNSNLIQNPGYR